MSKTRLNGSKPLSDLDTDEDLATLRAERNLTNSALEELDSLIPDAPDMSFEDEVTHADFPRQEPRTGRTTLSDVTAPIWKTASGFQDETKRLAFFAMILIFVAFLIVMIGEGKIKLPSVAW